MKNQAKAESRTFILIGGKLCLDFVNTVSNYGSIENHSEYFKTYEDLISWSEQAGIFSDAEAGRLRKEAARRPIKAAETLARAIEFRELLHRIFSKAANQKPPTGSDLKTLNREISAAMAHSEIVASEGKFVWQWVDKGISLDAMLWRVARSSAELLISEELTRVKECADTVCRWLFMDKSKNRSRRWCDMKDCGNVAKSRRFYERNKLEAKKTQDY